METISKSDQKRYLREERNHMEDILNQRFNFFIAIFGFIIVAITFVNNPAQLKLIFVIGSIIEAVFTLLIGRAQRKLSIFNKHLNKLEKDYPIAEIKKKANDGCFLNPFKYSVVKLMGYVLPITITISLILSSVFANTIFNYFKSE
jgi:disulfide bond formation protein DsbB